MGILTNIFYLISTSLLIPVMLALLWCLVLALMLAGKLLREYSSRAAARTALDEFSRALVQADLPLPRLPDSGLVARTLSRLVGVADNHALADKIVHDCQLTWQEDVEQLRSLARLGPALGLMGTLIPLGPALVGLAAGDLQMMSQNLVIAFATTVVGLLVGTLTTTFAGIKKRWYQADAVLVTFAANRLPQLKPQRNTSVASEANSKDEPAGGNGVARTRDAASTRAKESSHA